MEDDGRRIERWERQRKEFLMEVCSTLELGEFNLNTDPLAILAALDEFVAGQDYGSMDEDDWIWLQTFLAAYVAQVFIVEFKAKWEIVIDDRGESHRLVVVGLDGAERAFSPIDLVYEDFRTGMHPEIVRILATAEVKAAVVPLV